MGSQDCVRPRCYSLQKGAAVGADVSQAKDGADGSPSHIMHLVTVTDVCWLPNTVLVASEMSRTRKAREAKEIALAIVELELLEMPLSGTV